MPSSPEELKFFNENIKFSRLYPSYFSKIDHHYVRLLKGFRTAKKPVITGSYYHKDGRVPDESLLETFPLRFYLPIDALTRKPSAKSNTQTAGDRRIEHLVIMINGLDEHKKSMTRQYDVLGANFARKNIASVLLSTPFHLHRTVGYSPRGSAVTATDGPSSATNIFKPSTVIIDDWRNLFSLYDTTFHDISKLIGKVRGENPAELFSNEADHDFYKTYFHSNAKISILGYSLGGLIALGFYLLKHELVDKCILFNAPGSLQSARTDEMGIPWEMWEPTLTALGHDAKVRDELRDLGCESEYASCFCGLMNSSPSIPMKKVIYENRNDILQIICGDDSVIDMAPWEAYFDKKEHGHIRKVISQHIFSGIDHSPLASSRGSELMPNISRIIIDHILSDEHWQQSDIDAKLIPLLSKSGYVIETLFPRITKPDEKHFTNADLDSLLEDLALEERQEFLKFYHLSKIYYPRFYDVIEKTEKDLIMKTRKRHG